MRIGIRESKDTMIVTRRHPRAESASPARTRRLAGAIVAVAGVITLVTALPAAAVDPDEIGVFPKWTVSGSAGAFTATPAFPASAGFPATTVTSTGTTLAAPSGVTAFLGATTDFGAEFGSTRAQPYLTLAPAAGQTNSVTTLTFASPPPDGWGFALGDVDADWSFIQAYAGPGLTNPVSVADLGYRSSGNYCNNSPKPGSCAAGPYTDAPVWVTAPELFDGTNYVPGTLRGNSLPGSPAATRDTSGAYAWFVPTVPITTLRITFGIREGFPTQQLWLASPAPKVVVSGVVTSPDAPSGQSAPPGTSIQISDANGEPLQGLDDQPLQVPVDPTTGTYTVELEQAADGYEAVVVPPPGFTAPPPFEIPGEPDTPGGTGATAPPVEIAAVATPSDPGAPTGEEPTPGLAVSGPDPTQTPLLLTVGTALVAAGLMLRMRRRASR